MTLDTQKDGVMTIAPIADIRTDVPEKFGLPRQSGLVPELSGRIYFREPYRNKEAVMGLSEFSHIWVIWQFSEHVAKMESDGWQPTVRPPKLGGNKRMGVFATRSPFRPNNLGLSVLSLQDVVTEGKEAPYLLVAGVDMVDGTPIYDIKPYVPYADSHPDANGGFTGKGKDSGVKRTLSVEIPKELSDVLPQEKMTALSHMLSLDPRPSYQRDEREYAFSFADKTVRFFVENGTAHVIEIK